MRIFSQHCSIVIALRLFNAIPFDIDFIFSKCLIYWNPVTSTKLISMLTLSFQNCPFIRLKIIFLTFFKHTFQQSNCSFMWRAESGCYHQILIWYTLKTLTLICELWTKPGIHKPGILSTNDAPWHSQIRIFHKIQKQRFAADFFPKMTPHDFPKMSQIIWAR